MNLLKNIQAVYFVGIGGIGMSALARFVATQKIAVYGYDKTATTLTASLAKEGMLISQKDEIKTIPPQARNPKETLVVYTPAIPKNSKILNWFESRNFKMMKRSAFLGEITKDTLCLAVAGTHGKTTTSAILGHLLAACDLPVTAFLGGIATNYNSNFIAKGNKITVVEADEFDRSFLALHPDIACITSMDADHLDIYGDEHQLENSFKDFAALLPDSKNLFFKKGLPLNGQAVEVNDVANVTAANVHIKNGAYVFDFKWNEIVLKELTFHLPGKHNLHNATTALAMAIAAQAPLGKLPKALATFSGVDRRFSYRIKDEEQVLIDDYAHHPTEINALFQAVSELYPEDKKCIVFQPHLFSRTRDFGEGFAISLAQFDEVFLLDIYPAREVPIEGITSEWLALQIKKINTKVNVIEMSEISSRLKASACRVKLMVGAGDIGALVQTVSKKLQYEGELE